MAIAADLQAEIEALENANLFDDCRKHPANLLQYVRCVDAKTGETFEFQLHDEKAGWYWQRGLLDGWLASEKSIDLKARQIGITWLGGGLALWKLLFVAGSRNLAVSINEAEAAKLVNRCWDMYESLPTFLTSHVQVLKPAHGHRPSTLIELEHPDGKISTLLGLPSTPKAGHGETAALVLLDEFSRQEYARETWKAILPTMAGGGKVVCISTANGVSNEVTGEGNFFHHLWSNAEEYGLAKKFLPWSLHPDRDDSWYSREAMALPARDRAEQYPSDADEAFILSGDVWFDVEAIAWYRKNAVKPWLYRGEFVRVEADRARLEKRDLGCLRVYKEPDKEGSYAIGADVATGRGADYSCAFVVDLSDMAIVAELHGKLDADKYTYQLHFLGKWFNSALLAVEQGGGFGEPVTIFLRDGKDGRPPYRHLYRHRSFSRPDQLEHKKYGFPMTLQTRPLVLSGLQRAVREHSPPWLPDSLLTEMRTFVNRESGTSPRAQEGCNDDRVMAAAIALELYREHGHHPDRVIRKAAKPKRHWLSLGEEEQRVPTFRM